MLKSNFNLSLYSQKRKMIIEYSDYPDEVVKKITNELKEFGLTINNIGGGSGYEEYEIIKIKD